MDDYAVRCFINDERKLTDKLRPDDAAIFRHAALHLVKYLTKEYHLVPLTEEQVDALVNVK